MGSPAPLATADDNFELPLPPPPPPVEFLQQSQQDFDGNTNRIGGSGTGGPATPHHHLLYQISLTHLLTMVAMVLI